MLQPPEVEAAPVQVPAHRTEVFTQKSSQYAVLVFVLNEGERIRAQLHDMRALALRFDVVVADGGSTDGALDEGSLRSWGVRALITKIGPGRLSAQMRVALAWALEEGYDGVITIDGNGKDDISAIPDFAHQLDAGIDHVQGSRFIPGGQAINTPLSRLLGVRLVHAPLISLAAHRWHTDTTNGFRAYSARLIRDPAIAVFRDVFSNYELHYHLAIESSRATRLRTSEIPVTRRYPRGVATPTKISPIKGNAAVLVQLLNAVLGKYRA